MKYASSFFALGVGLVVADLLVWHMFAVPELHAGALFVFAFATACWALLAVPLLWWLDEARVRHAWQAALLGAGLAIAAFVALIGSLTDTDFSRMAGDPWLLGVATIGLVAGMVHYALRRTRLRDVTERRRRAALPLLWLAPLVAVLLMSGTAGAIAMRLSACRTYARGPDVWRDAAFYRLTHDLARRRDYAAARAGCPTLFPPAASRSTIEVFDPRFDTGRRFGYRYHLSPDGRTVVASNLDYLDP